MEENQSKPWGPAAATLPGCGNDPRLSRAEAFLRSGLWTQEPEEGQGSQPGPGSTASGGLTLVPSPAHHRPWEEPEGPARTKVGTEATCQLHRAARGIRTANLALTAAPGSSVGGGVCVIQMDMCVRAKTSLAAKRRSEEPVGQLEPFTQTFLKDD